MRIILILISLFICNVISAQTWIDSLDNYARERISPPLKFDLTWQNAPLLHVMELQYEMMPAGEKQKYLDYVKVAIDKNLATVNGILPNNVAPGNGLAFLYRILGDTKYLNKALKVYEEYNNILRTSNGGISHIPVAPELWDDTVYMIGVYFLAMYRATNDESYLLELINQIKKHREKLIVEEWGLWVHGWDDNNVYNLDFCSQSSWADKDTRRSAEIWGRGNGWVVVTLSEILNNISPSHPEWEFASSTLKEMIIHLPELQDENTGHWYQLPVRKGEPRNYIESSSTAMFGYGILTALKYNIVEGEDFENAVEMAYNGLRKHSVVLVGTNERPYLNTQNVALETCLGDKNYYFNISTGGGKPYASAVFIMFGRAYDEIHGTVTGINNFSNSPYTIQVSPTVVSKSTELNIRVVAPENETVQYVLVDILGRKLQQESQNLIKGENTNRFKLLDFKSGTYFLLIKSQNSGIVKSFPIFIN